MTVSHRCATPYPKPMQPEVWVLWRNVVLIFITPSAGSVINTSLLQQSIFIQIGSSFISVQIRFAAKQVQVRSGLSPNAIWKTTNQLFLKIKSFFIWLVDKVFCTRMVVHCLPWTWRPWKPPFWVLNVCFFKSFCLLCAVRHPSIRFFAVTSSTTFLLRQFITFNPLWLK